MTQHSAELANGLLRESGKLEGKLELAATRLEDLTADKARLEAEHAGQLRDMAADRARLEAEHAALRSLMLGKIEKLDADKGELEVALAQERTRQLPQDGAVLQLEARLEGVLREHEEAKSGLHDQLVQERERAEQLQVQLAGARRELEGHEADKAELQGARKKLEVLDRIKAALVP